MLERYFHASDLTPRCTNRSFDHQKNSNIYLVSTLVSVNERGGPSLVISVTDSGAAIRAT